MKPLIRSGSLLRIAPLSHGPSGGDPTLGDIVLLAAPSGRLVAHRIIAIDGDAYRTKGDSSGEPDGRVERHQLLGKVLGIESLIFLPLDGPRARRIGLWINRYYPRLVRWKAAIRARSGRAPRLAGEGS